MQVSPELVTLWIERLAFVAVVLGAVLMLTLL